MNEFALPEATSSLELRVARLQQQVEQLEARVAELERRGPARSRGGGGGGGPVVGPRPEWAVPYQATELEVGETWIEMHEPSARPQLHRLIRQLAEVEGPITDLYALRRVREAWGVKRAGARIQQVFEQALRQLVARGDLRRVGNTVLQPDQQLDAVRVPDSDDTSRRSVDEIPVIELELALRKVVQDAGRMAPDEATMQVARLFGWTRRGTGIQSTLDAGVQALVNRGELVREGDSLSLPID